MTPAPADRDPVAVLGAGVVGRTLARGWARAGREVVLGSRDPESGRLRAALAELAGDVPGARVSAATHRDAAARAAIVVITVPGEEVRNLLGEVGDALVDKVAIDTTNNLTPGARAPDSLRLLRVAGATAYRAYNSIGWEQMDRPVFGQVRSSLAFTGPDSRREAVAGLIADTGFDPVHLGDDDAAVEAVNALASLWFLLAFNRGRGRRLGYRILTAADDETP